MAISYDENSPAVVSEMMALKAAVEPTFITQIHAVMKAQRATARMGRAELVLTCGNG